MYFKILRNIISYIIDSNIWEFLQNGGIPKSTMEFKYQIMVIQDDWKFEVTERRAELGWTG